MGFFRFHRMTFFIEKKKKIKIHIRLLLFPDNLQELTKWKKNDIVENLEKIKKKTIEWKRKFRFLQYCVTKLNLIPTKGWSISKTLIFNVTWDQISYSDWQNQNTNKFFKKNSNRLWISKLLFDSNFSIFRRKIRKNRKWKVYRGSRKMEKIKWKSLYRTNFLLRQYWYLMRLLYSHIYCRCRLYGIANLMSFCFFSVHSRLTFI